MNKQEYNRLEAELLPCPFCGKTDDIEIGETLPECSTELVWAISCCSTMVGFTTKEDAIEAWNTRTNPAEPVQKNT